MATTLESKHLAHRAPRRAAGALLTLTQLAAFCLALAFSASPASAADPSSPKTVSALRVALDDNYPPYVFRDDTGKLVGYLVDAWALWEKKTGVHIDLLASDWAIAQQQIRDGHADVIDTVFETEERKQWLDFSPAYARVPVAVYTQSKISGISSAETLRGFVVGVKAGDACINWLEKERILAQRLYPSYQTLIGAAINGEIQVFCVDEPPADFLLTRQGAEHDFKRAFSLYTGEFHRAVAKGNASTLALVERGFDAITPDEVQALRQKWMGTPLDQHADLSLGRLKKPLLFGLLGLALVAAWIATLRRAVRQRTEELSATLAAIPDHLYELDLQGRFYQYHSRHPESMTRTGRALLGKHVSETLPADAAAAVLRALAEANEHGNSSGQQIEISTPKGPRWYELSAARKGERTGAKARFIVLSRDITPHKDAEQAIRQLAQYDLLTGLPNRILLNDRIEYMLGRARRTREPFALMFLDLDRFKNVNDSLGHQVGDQLLIDLARRLKSTLREEDTISRLGGDEFIILLPNTDTAGAARVAEKLLDITAPAYRINQHELTCTASIGIAIYPEDGTTFELLSMCADTAMYRAKKAGRNTYCFFTLEMQQNSGRALKLENALRRALEHNELCLHYQPQLSLVTGRIIGVEALLRWRHPVLGNISPAEFIPIAEDSGLILPIGEWVMRTAARQLRSWFDQGIAPMVVSVNLSAVQFRQSSLIQRITNILNETALDPKAFELELTEGLTMDNPEVAIGIMAQLDELGVRMVIDDFGTGYSSMSYIKRFRAYKLKIDQSFVHDLGSDPESEAIVMAIISLAHTLGMTTIAEGVETQEQLNFLREKGCDEVQGYFFSRPLPADQFVQFAEAIERAGHADFGDATQPPGQSPLPLGITPV